MSRILTVLTLAGLSVCSVSVGFAQSKQPVTVTGCLAQGDEKNEYSIKDSSGKTYGLLGTTVVRIPLKANAFPEGSRTGFRDDSEHRSERSDAGLSIVQEVFGFVKMLRIRSAAED